MNFLAHAYLSFDHPEIVTGNMISDFVKGSSKYNYAVGIQKGITLHREIDHFTDHHIATQKAKQLFRPFYRLYSGAIMDILYDHFLANDPSVFTGTTLKEFTQKIYKYLEQYTAQLPERFVQVFAYMRADDWLYNYRTKKGMERSLSGLIRRAAYLSDSAPAYNLFLENYEQLNELYNSFFPDVKQFAKDKLDQHLL